MTPRRPDAIPRLVSLMADRANQPFAWGVRDCMTLGADATLAVCGRDPLQGIRGTYTTARGAAQALRAQGGWWAGLATIIGPRVIDAAHTWPGDVALLPQRQDASTCGLRGAAAGFVWRDCIVAQGEHGLVTAPLSRALAFWRPAP